jgi:hypothetical protein
MPINLKKQTCDLIFRVFSISCVFLSHSLSLPSLSTLISQSQSFFIFSFETSGQVHSGSPFRLLLEDARFAANEQSAFIEFAAQGSQCSAEHVAYLDSYSQTSKAQTHIVWLLKDLRASDPKPGFKYCQVTFVFQLNV